PRAVHLLALVVDLLLDLLLLVLVLARQRDLRRLDLLLEIGDALAGLLLAGSHDREPRRRLLGLLAVEAHRGEERGEVVVVVLRVLLVRMVVALAAEDARAEEG